MKVICPLWNKCVHADRMNWGGCQHSFIHTKGKTCGAGRRENGRKCPMCKSDRKKGRKNP